MKQGTVVDPFALAEALTSPRIKPGHTLYLRGGTYSGDFISTLTGVTVKAYQNEQPIIDGSLTINGSDCTFEQIELMYSGWTTRVTLQTGSTPSDLPISKSLNIFGPRTTMRRCIMHDLAGPGWWTPAGDGLLEECLFFNNGWDAPDRGHGHGLYAQNLTGTKTILRCVFTGGYSDYNIHCYTEGGSIQGFTFEECVSIARVCLVGGYAPVDRLAFTRCILFGGQLATGYDAATANIAATLTDNILANGANRVIRGTWDSLVETGTDTTIGNRVLTYGNLVIVFNQAGAASVLAPKAGTYINCQNPAESVLLTEGMALPMTGWTVAVPIAGTGPLTNWDNRFGVFMVTP